MKVGWDIACPEPGFVRVPRAIFSVKKLFFLVSCAFQTAKHIHLIKYRSVSLFLYICIYLIIFFKQGVLLSKHTAFRPSPVLVSVQF